ncbi:primosomal protein N' [Gulosibacter macacae]|uniref:Probable replication restart protein PriA n=1 Tax=Gulosibacter macacae TaxID=2488791 RepID=A0A3P3VYY0_9MICO|nr:primosomal protein N' [Gulosibacter macacae]RRJ87278.1 primosomal protein N' [Gulosibacter macacae]
MPTVARVALDSPLPQLDRVFEYAIPEPLRERVVPGIRVKVPLRVGGRIISAWVVGVADKAEYAGRLAEVDSVVSEARVLTPELIRLARGIADRQAGAFADVVRLAIPARSARLEGRWLEDADGERAARAQRPEPIAAPATTDASSPSWAAELLANDGAQAPARITLRVPVGLAPGSSEPRHLGALADLVTESVASGRSAILLVPDFRDLALAVAALERRLPASRIRRFDSRLKPMPRYDEFLRALEPVPQVIIGTRNAVWAPAHELGLIAMWDDGDESYREPHTPYPHTREVALMRAQQQDAALVLAAHAPSLESRRLVATGWMQEMQVPGAARPKVIPADATLSDDPLARSARIPQAAWRAAREALTHGPVLVQVGRAGYRPALACANCRTPARCQRCHGPLGQPSAQRPPACTVCGAVHANWHCAECSGTALRASAIGHERTGEELGRAFPGVPVIVADGGRELIEIGDAPALIVATRGAEPVAAGGYFAVLLLDAENALARESLDTVGDSLRAWSNAAALVADGAPVIITGAPSAPLHALRDWQQAGLADLELAERRALDFPPAMRVATVRGSEAEVEAALHRLDELQLPELHVLGPVPDPDEPGRIRATLRFSYRAGEAIATALKTELVAQATSSRRRVANRAVAHASTLRVHFDASDVF